MCIVTHNLDIVKAKLYSVCYFLKFTIDQYFVKIPYSQPKFDLQEDDFSVSFFHDTVFHVIYLC